MRMAWCHGRQVNGSKIRHIGVTNFDVPRLEEMLSAGVPIVSNQARLPPVSQHLEMHDAMVSTPASTGLLVLYGHWSCSAVCRAPQVQYSLLDRRPENGMAQFCADRGIKLLPYGVVSGGLLSDKYLGMPAAQ